MLIRVLEYEDRSSPGTRTPERGEREPKGEEWIAVDDELVTPQMRALIEEEGAHNRSL